MFKNKGMDISFVKDEKLACSGLFVFDLSDDFIIVYQDLDTELITMDQPYAPGFLAYREAPFLLKKLEKLKKEKPILYPQCIFIDGTNSSNSCN
jgi:deoxyinosine 3'endonuclease (endonuclease V)